MRIAFHTLNAYDMLVGSNDGTVGGSQLQQVLLGRELANRGHEVVFIENGADHKEEGLIDGIEVVVKQLPETGSLPSRLIRSVSRTVRVLRRVDPDVCYRRVLNFDMLPIYLYSRVTKTKFVYNFAHDSEVTSDPVVLDRPITDNIIYKKLMWKVLSGANRLVAQNRYQYEKATKRFGDHVVKIPNGYPLKDREPTDKTNSNMVLWVGTIRPWKHPEKVFELARNLPKAEFVIVGGRSGESPELYDLVEEAAGELENVRFEGFVPFTEINSYFEEASLFVNTSDAEGFPNTFLQAWAHSIPVLSLSVNPDDVLSENDVGFVTGGSLVELSQRIGYLLDNESQRLEMGAEALKYMHRTHSLSEVTSRYESVFRGS